MANTRKTIGRTSCMLGIFLVCGAGCSDGLKTDNSPLQGVPLYSETMRAVLESDAVATLISNYFSDPTNADYLACPYAFLQKQGYDVAAVKQAPENLFCRAQTDGTSLTIYLRAQTDGTEINENYPYYTFYTIRYALTEQEKSELTLLFEGEYVEAPFYVQAIAQTKTEEILSELHVSKRAWTQLEETLSYEDALPPNVIPFLTCYTKDVLSLTLYEESMEYERACLPSLSVETEVSQTEIEALRIKENEPVWSSTLIPLVTSFYDSIEWEESFAEEATHLPIAHAQFLRKLK